MSPYFDRYFYLTTNADVAATGEDPLQHFMAFGWKENRKPRSDFEPAQYYACNPDVPADMNAFLHYIEHGMSEGRATKVMEEAEVVVIRRRIAELEAELSKHISAVPLDDDTKHILEQRNAVLIESFRSEVEEVKHGLTDALASVGRQNSELLEITSAARGADARQRQFGSAVDNLEKLLIGMTMASRSVVADGPLVSVIMPTCNRAWLLKRAIASVRSQLYENWELIIVGDGCADETSATVSAFSDARIRLVTLSSRQGAPVARNTALCLATGEIVTYLDDDNYWFPEYLARTVAAYRSDPDMRCAYGALFFFDADPAGSRLLWSPFDRKALLTENFIDLNAFSHKKSVTDECGGFDESLARLQDWDLILRCTAASPAIALPIPAVVYHRDTPDRITTSAPLFHAYHCVRSKWRGEWHKRQSFRVLYAVYHYPQASETYIEAEIRFMRRNGIHIEVWSQAGVATPYATDLTIHRGSLEEAIERSRPDLLHTHWLNCALDYATAHGAHGVPMTARAHGFEVGDTIVHSLLAQPAVRKLFLYPHQLPDRSDAADPRIEVVQNGFDTEIFKPNKSKNRRMIVRAAAGLASKDLRLFLELAKRLPEHRFVLGAIACGFRESYIGELLEMRSHLNSPVELHINVPHEAMAKLIGEAGIYLHTAVPPGEPHATPIGQPISIAEAMATGAYVLTRDLPPLRDYVGDAGSGYRDVDEAERLIAATTEWSEARWEQAYVRSVDRAWSTHNPDRCFAPIRDAWIDILGQDFGAGRLCRGELR